MVEKYDAVVVGSGQGGGPLSTALVASGYRTALIEREHIGGTCINTGCSPTKTMIASGRVAYLVRRSAEYGVGHGPADIDMRRIRQRKRDIVESFRSGSERSIRNGGVEIIMGEARFIGPRLLQVTLEEGERRELSADRVFLDTGTRPIIPPISGLDGIPYLDSTSIMELDAVPEHLGILGGGYIGLEFGQLFRRLGSRVTIVEHGPRLIPREDHDVADALVEILKQDGIEILTGTSAAEVSGTVGSIELTLDTSSRQEKLCTTHLLVATGR
ncbi:MAG TPA: FAD-dependent oxidoreductase, partial [Chloroflexota bacterium]